VDPALSGFERNDARHRRCSSWSFGEVCGSVNSTSTAKHSLAPMAPTLRMIPSASPYFSCCCCCCCCCWSCSCQPQTPGHDCRIHEERRQSLLACCDNNKRERLGSPRRWIPEGFLVARSTKRCVWKNGRNVSVSVCDFDFDFDLDRVAAGSTNTLPHCCFAQQRASLSMTMAMVIVIVMAMATMMRSSSWRR